MSTLNLIVCLFILIISLIGFRVLVLTLSGAVGAFFVGIFVYIGIDFKGLILLGVFFATSSFWSYYKRENKKTLHDIIEKEGSRDCVQVFANGGVAAISSFLYFYFQDPLYLFLFQVSIASANADTWASEIGSLSKKNPISILTFKRKPQGTSGAVSALGMLAGLSGAFFIAIASKILWPETSLELVAFIIIFGFLGNIADSLLGEILQVKYKCQKCGKIVEKKMHCQTKTNIYKGISSINNDVINITSIIIAVIFAYYAYIIAM